MINLVKNAKKFTRKGSINVAASYNAQLESLIVHVADTGVGIKQSELPKLFTRFGKLMRTAELNNEGIGLGLTIVQGIVKQA